MDDPWVVLGKIVKPQGLKGEVRVRSEIVDPENFLLSGLKLRSPEGVLCELEVVSYRRHKGVWILRLAGCNSIEEATRLLGSELICRGSRLPPPEDDEYYHFELLRRPVFDAAGRRLGRLEEIIPTPGHDVLVIRPVPVEDGGPDELGCGREELLLPMVAAYVLKVDRERGRIIVDPTGTSGREAGCGIEP